jgi:hypothetical protein
MAFGWLSQCLFGALCAPWTALAPWHDAHEILATAPERSSSMVTPSPLDRVDSQAAFEE